MPATLKPGFHKANFEHDNDQFRVKTKQLVGGMTAQPPNRFVSCVVVVEFAVNGNQALRLIWRPGFKKYLQRNGKLLSSGHENRASP